MKNALIGRNGYGAGSIDDPVDVGRRNLVITNRHDAVRVETAHMTAGNPGIHRIDLTARH